MGWAGDEVNLSRFEIGVSKSVSRGYAANRSRCNPDKQVEAILSTWHTLEVQIPEWVIGLGGRTQKGVP